MQNLGPGQSQVAGRAVSAGQIVRDQPGVKEQVGVYHAGRWCQPTTLLPISATNSSRSVVPVLLRMMIVTSSSRKR